MGISTATMLIININRSEIRSGKKTVAKIKKPATNQIFPANRWVAFQFASLFSVQIIFMPIVRFCFAFGIKLPITINISPKIMLVKAFILGEYPSAAART